MRKNFQGTFAATVMLWVYAVALGIASGTVAGGVLPKQSQLASQAALPLIIAWWVVADAQKRGRELCYDYGSFVYFAWPVVLPVYLFRTRGVRALLTMLWFGAIWVTVGLVTALVILIRGG